ncbi:hypothetical protein BGZ99_001274 [Dissophora globulifera]|uniref:Protein kinase domain-containing protein n=1 Tax=Dissophora globulifera TaxID=979702 RepID=A0A9P6RQS1_9FUNG|nr:hypothetical protein BGZ99_001274 [Dissophora globulifera]
MNHKEGAGERKRRRRSLSMTELPASWLAPESNLPSPPTSSTGPFSLLASSINTAFNDNNHSGNNDDDDSSGGSDKEDNCTVDTDSDNDIDESVSSTPRSFLRSQSYNERHSPWTPDASTATDVWAVGVACIELSQGRPPRPDMPILAMFGDQRHTGLKPQQLHHQSQREDGFLGIKPDNGFGSSFRGGYAEMFGNAGGVSWSNGQGAEDVHGVAQMDMSEEMWSFIAKCLTPVPEARPAVLDLLQDTFIVQNNKPCEELLARIRNMMDFVDHCTLISSSDVTSTPRHTENATTAATTVSYLLSPTSPSSLSLTAALSPLVSPSMTLSPLKASHMVDITLDEASIGPWLIPLVRPSVGSLYDASSFFDESGLPLPPPEPDTSGHVSGWKNQRISHPIVKQVLSRGQAGYMIFRHSRSPSLATIKESELEE